MLRFVVIFLAIPACILSGIGGAIIGICGELHWPLSEENLNETIEWGIGVGLLGAVATALVLLAVPRERLWWIVVSSLGLGTTAVVSCASMWWIVVSSLG